MEQMREDAFDYFIHWMNEKNAAEPEATTVKVLGNYSWKVGYMKRYILGGNAHIILGLIVTVFCDFIASCS